MKRLQYVTRQREQHAADPTTPEHERRAMVRAKPYIAEFQDYADSVKDKPDALALVTAWWRARGIVCDFYFANNGEFTELKSRSARCVEDLPS